jgi:cobalt/nickel transport system ATP-binding protein
MLDGEAVAMIKIENLSFVYPDGTQALKDVSLEILNGEILALIGASGCGKTTLLKNLIGLLKPTRGRLWLEGREFRYFKPEEIFRRVGMVFQDPNDQLFAATVEQDVAFGGVNLGFTAEEVDQRVKEALQMVEAQELSGKGIHTLSFGQKKRISLAGVLAMGPSLILLDEPTSGLDPRSVSAIMRLLRTLNKEKRITMVISTHDVELIPLFCDRVAVMGGGMIKEMGTSESIFTDVALLRKSGMRLPRITHLMEILQEEDGIVLSQMPLTIGAARRELLKLLTGGETVGPTQRE